MAGMLQKAMLGGAQAGEAISLENFKADVLRKRDERLFGQQQQAQDRQWARDDVTRAEDQAIRESEFNQEQSNWDKRFGLDQQAQQASIDNDNRRLDIAEQGLEMDRERLDLTAQQIQQELDKGEFGLIEAQRLQGIHDVIINPDSSQEQVSTAVQMLRNMQGAEPQKYEFIKISGDGYTPDRIFRGNPGTGEGGIMDLSGSSSGESVPLPENDPFNGDPESTVLRNLKAANPDMSDEDLLEYIRTQRTSN